MDQRNNVIDFVLGSGIDRRQLRLELQTLDLELVPIGRASLRQPFLFPALGEHFVPFVLVFLVIPTRRFTLAFFVRFVAVVDPVVLFDRAFAVALVHTLPTSSAACEPLANVTVFAWLACEVVGRTLAARFLESLWKFPFFHRLAWSVTPDRRSGEPILRQEIVKVEKPG